MNETFAEVVAGQRTQDERRQSELKLEYERLGLGWPTGRRLT